MRQQVVFSSVTPADKYSANATDTLTTVVTTGAEVRQLSNADLVRQGYDQDTLVLQLRCIRSSLLDSIETSHVVTYRTERFEIIGINRFDYLSNMITFNVRRVE